MNEYIKREDALDAVLFALVGTGYQSKAIYAIRDVPTADVVEVVRCKDCKHNPNNGGDCDRSITHTSRDYLCEVNTYRYINIDFCSYGERIEKCEIG